VVRRPDPLPCPACAAGQPDFCLNGQYAERGIKALDGYGATRWRVAPDFAVRVPGQLGDLGVLTEPASVVVKAWEQVDRFAQRAPRQNGWIALVTGAGPIGLLAALLGVQRGYQVHVFDRITGGLKPALIAALGATLPSRPGQPPRPAPGRGPRMRRRRGPDRRTRHPARPGRRVVPGRHLLEPVSPGRRHEPDRRLDSAGQLGDLRLR
jgi:hypothetical protein